MWKAYLSPKCFALDSKSIASGLIKDDRTLREQKVVSSCKMIAVGSTIDEVVEVQPPNPTELKQLMEESAG